MFRRLIQTYQVTTLLGIGCLNRNTPEEAAMNTEANNAKMDFVAAADVFAVDPSATNFQKLTVAALRHQEARTQMREKVRAEFRATWGEPVPAWNPPNRK
jgi:hypothetical protein